MQIILASLLLAVFAALQVLAGDKGDSPPIAVTQAEPDYGPDLSKSYLVNPASVTMTIDDRGVPFSLSGSALPDNVVIALSQWRYRPGRKDGANVPFSISFVLPVRVPLNTTSERTLRRRSYYATKTISNALDSGTGLNLGGAENLEHSLTTDLNNIDIRAQLLLYSIETASTNPKDAADRRAKHIEYLVQNLPGERILASPLTAINTAAGPVPDAEAYARIRDLWLNQLSAKPDDPVTLEHATYFLRISNPEKTEQLLAPAIRLLPDASIWLGDLYGLAVLGVNGIDLKTGLASSVPTTLPVTPFAQKARATLLGTNNAKVLLSALNTVTEHGRALAHRDELPEGYAGLCTQLLTRAKEFHPGTMISCDPSAAAPEPQQQVTRIRVGGSVQQAQLIKKVSPQYPLDAKAIGLQGVVRFTATIGKDGAIEDLSLVSGPLAFYKASRDAVRQWTYRPTLLNGNPVEIITTIEVNYTLSR
jgi:hypothetical protein